MRHGRAGGRRRFLVTEGGAPGEEGEGGAGGEETHLAECLYEDYSTKCFTPLGAPRPPRYSSRSA